MKVGEYLIYPAHGLVKLARMDLREVGGIKRKFMVLQVEHTGMTIMVPEDQAANDWIGLRPLASKTLIDAVIALIADKYSGEQPSTAWSKRYRDYHERIKSGSLTKIAQVVRELAIIRTKSDLSFGERHMFDQAVGRIADEMSVVLKVSVADARELVLSAAAYEGVV